MLRHHRILMLVFFLALGWLGLVPVQIPGAEDNPKKQSAETAPVPHVIKSAANLVLVDVAVTDKKKQYLKDLEQKEFHVYEDGVEQNIVSFSREADVKPDAPERQRYMILFFDNSTMDVTAQQIEERQAAAKFVEMTASPNRLMAVVDFGGVLHVAQNFTANGDRLNDAVKTAQFSSVQTNAAGRRGGPMQAEFATRALLLSLRDVAKMLSPVPGRKIMILFSAGFVSGAEHEAEFQDTLDALNKANIGVYTVDALALGRSGISAQANPPAQPNANPRRMQNMRPDLGANNPLNPEVLRTFAAHTGGFPIVDTNDLLGGMVRISQEIDQSYVLGYVPPNPVFDGSYHKIRVKVDRKGVEVRARDGYFDMKNPDLLAAKPEGKALEAQAASPDAGNIPVSLSAPYFYVQPGVALVNLALSFPGSALEFEKQKGVFHSHVDILGIAYRDDGSVAARFSDTVKLDFDKEQEEQQTASVPFAYQKCFKIAPGTYTLKVLLNAGGQKFGKIALPLVVDPFTGAEFTLGGPAFGDKIVRLAPRSEDMDQALLENTKPLIANGVQIVPSAGNHFTKSVPPIVYLEVYDPSLKSGDVRVGIQYKIVDSKAQRTIYTSDTTVINPLAHEGNPLVPVGFRLSIDNIPAGDYRIEFSGRDSAGNTTEVRSGDFSIE
jgi:VWFA-related protein